MVCLTVKDTVMTMDNEPTSCLKNKLPQETMVVLSIVPKHFPAVQLGKVKAGVEIVYQYSDHDLTSFRALSEHLSIDLNDLIQLLIPSPL